MTMTLTAGAPLPTLVDSLARAGWGDLEGREWQGVRAALRGLVVLLPRRAGAGEMTVPQLADAAGMSERWARRCLTVLEDMGLVRWARGGVQGGRPTPSLVRVSKRTVLALVRAARRVHDDALAKRRAETLDRIRAARLVWTVGGRRLRRSAHAALSTPLPPYGEETGRPSGAPLVLTSQSTCEHDEPAGSCPSCHPRPVRDHRLPARGKRWAEDTECPHGAEAPKLCAFCRKAGAA